MCFFWTNLQISLRITHPTYHFYLPMKISISQGQPKPYFRTYYHVQMDVKEASL
jgi:hypothetical protein